MKGINKRVREQKISEISSEIFKSNWDQYLNQICTSGQTTLIH